MKRECLQLAEYIDDSRSLSTRPMVTGLNPCGSE